MLVLGRRRQERQRRGPQLVRQVQAGRHRRRTALRQRLARLGRLGWLGRLGRIGKGPSSSQFQWANQPAPIHGTQLGGDPVKLY